MVLDEDYTVLPLEIPINTPGYSVARKSGSTIRLPMTSTKPNKASSAVAIIFLQGGEG